MKTRKPKKAAFHFNDAEAFKLLSALLEDFKAHLPIDLYKFIHGRIRSRDYEFIVDTFPSSVLPLMQVERMDGGVTLSIAGREFSLGDDPKRTIQLLYVASNFLKKYPFSDSPVYTDELRERTALRSFRKAEKWCYIVNRRVEKGLSPLFITEAKRTLRWLLGDVPDYDKIVDLSYFGPGVNVGVDGSSTDSQVKFSLDMTITRALRNQLNAGADLMPGVFAHFGLRRYLENEGYAPPYDFHHLVGTKGRTGEQRYQSMIALGAMDLHYNRLKTVRSNKVALVPKTAKTFRSIAAEPMVNSFFQNGTGKYLARRLASKTEALNLRDQNRNRELARKGSETNLLATIDLSSASDTISMELVKLLVPKKWYQLLRLLRSPYYTYKGTTRKSHKLSSMGNGYTFPVESALFYSIVRAAIVEDMVDKGHTLEEARLFVQPIKGSMGIFEPSVYGDDIIIDSCFYDAVTRGLKLCGFWTNLDKSYSQGPFRESCGHDYHFGEYVRPLFLKEPITWKVETNVLINHILNPFGLGWLSERFDLSLTSFFGAAVKLHNSVGRKGEDRFGPMTGRSEPLFISIPTDELRTRGHIFEDKERHRWVYDPLVVKPRKYQNFSEFGVMMKSYHRNQGRRDPSFSNSLKTLVKRGSMVLRSPKRSTVCHRLSTLPSIQLGGVPETLDRWLANFARYRHLYPFLNGY